VPPGIHHAGTVISERDSIDHGHAAANHPAVQSPRARLSWQTEKNQKAPPTWKVGLVVILVLVLLVALEHISNVRAEERFQRICVGIRENIITYADAAANYMAVNHAQTVTVPQLIGTGPGQLKVAPENEINEDYSKTTFSDKKSTVMVRIPIAKGDAKLLYFNIHWKERGQPGFVSDAVTD